MPIVGYRNGIRSERRLCEEVHLNLAYRWFCRLGLEEAVPEPFPLFEECPRAVLRVRHVALGGRQGRTRLHGGRAVRRSSPTRLTIRSMLPKASACAESGPASWLACVSFPLGTDDHACRSVLKRAQREMTKPPLNAAAATLGFQYGKPVTPPFYK